MTTTELRDALDAVAHAVDVPTVDQVSFQAKVRAERARRGRRRLAVGGIAAAAAVVTGAVLLAPGSHPSDHGRISRPAPFPDVAPVAGQPYVPVLLAGKVVVLLPDGSDYAGPFPAGQVLGIGAQGVVYAGQDGHLELLPLAADGQPRQPHDVAGVPVARAVVSGDGRTLAWVGTDGDTHLRTPSWGYDTSTPAVPGRLVSASGTALLALSTGRLVLVDQGAPVTFSHSEPALSGQVAGDTVAYQTASGVQLFDLDGHQRFGDLGGAIGALSPDGARYATAPDDSQRESRRLAPTLRVVDTHTGDVTAIDGWDTRQHVLAFWWQSSDRFLVLTTTPRERGNHVAWSCSIQANSCARVYDDPTGTLQLPTG